MLMLRCYLDVQEKEMEQVVGYLGVIIVQMVVKIMRLDDITEGIVSVYTLLYFSISQDKNTMF